MIRKLYKEIDWSILGAVFPIILASLSTMTSFGGESSFFTKQLLWFGVGMVLLLVFAFFRR